MTLWSVFRVAELNPLHSAQALSAWVAGHSTFLD